MEKINTNKEKLKQTKTRFKPGVLEISINSLNDSDKIEIGDLVSFNNLSDIFKVMNLRFDSHCDICGYKVYVARPIEVIGVKKDVDIKYFNQRETSLYWEYISSRKKKVA